MTILDRIVADTRELVARRRRETPVGALEQRPLFDRTPLDLAAALRGEELAVIAEVKRASPSQGLIRPDFEPAAIAEGYARHGAAAVSVLTEPLHFRGALAHLEAVRAAVDLPLLRKDFVVDPYQLLEARACGADAVLLIAAVLDGPQLYDLHAAADELGLSCLVELYDAAELDRVDLDQVRLLGVNNRDLRTFAVNIEHAPRVFEHVPAGIVRVGESGMKTADDLAYLHRRGVDAVLVGETLMRADDPGAALERLRADVRRLLNRAPAPDADTAV